MMGTMGEGGEMMGKMGEGGEKSGGGLLEEGKEEEGIDDAA